MNTKSFFSILTEKVQRSRSVAFVDQMLWRIKYHRMKASCAEVAYFTLLSLFPFFMILLNVFSRISIAHADLVSEVLSVFPSEVRPVIDSVIIDLQTGFGSTSQLLITIAVAIYSASLGIKSMIMSCSLAFEDNYRKQGLKLVIAGLIFTVAFIALLVLLFITEILGDRIFSFIFEFFSFPSVVGKIWYYVKNIVTPIYIALIIFLLNRYSVTREIRKEVSLFGVLPGAVVSTLLMIFLSSVFSFQVSNTDRYAITYGSISSVIMLIVWLYLMGISLILGFEINGTLYEMKMNPDRAREKSVFQEFSQSLCEKK